MRRAVAQPTVQAAGGEKENQPILIRRARHRAPGGRLACKRQQRQAASAVSSFLRPVVALDEKLAEEKDLLQRSPFLDVEGGAATLRMVNECQDGDCPSHSFGD